MGATQAEALPPRQQPHRVRRTRLQSALVETVPPGLIHLKKALQSLVDLGDSVQLVFDDGSEVNADIVVGADGIRSVGCSKSFSGFHLTDTYNSLLEIAYTRTTRRSLLGPPFGERSFRSQR